MMNKKKIYSKVLQILTELWGIETAKKFDAKIRFHRDVDLKNPKTLADKVCYIELFDQHPMASECSDKNAVREYVKQRGYSQNLIPLVGGPWENFSEIDFEKLPNAFVLKATHGCKMNYMVPNKMELDYDECKKTVDLWLNTTYGIYSVEPHYAQIPHRIIAEQYLGEMSSMVDYKFHCLNGIPQFVLVVNNRKAECGKPMHVELSLYDTDWAPIEGLQKSNFEVPSKTLIEKPICLSYMIQMARDLAKDFKFVRVDLYEINGQVYFGELTFSPACGVFPYFDDIFNNKMGELLKL